MLFVLIVPAYSVDNRNVLDHDVQKIKTHFAFSNFFLRIMPFMR